MDAEVLRSVLILPQFFAITVLLAVLNKKPKAAADLVTTTAVETEAAADNAAEAVESEADSTWWKSAE